MNSKRNSNQWTRLTDYESENGEKHPMLLHAAGVATIAAACTNAGNALALTLTMLLLCLGMSVVYMYERGEYRQPMRSVVYIVPSALLLCGCGMLLNAVSPVCADSIAMYLPVAAADSLVLARLQPDAPFVPPSRALPEVLRLWWMYAVMALPVGALRELWSSGTLLGLRVFFNVGAQGMTLPFAGFLLIGFGLAIRQRRRDNAVR